MALPFSPFERLQVSEESLIDADRWQRVHAYHRTRQNTYFQALNHPGIVHGLGVTPIEAPEAISEAYRDGRWLQVKPGLAIDQDGNPIVVPQAMPVRIASEPHADVPMTVYLTLTYVDPDDLKEENNRFVTETFRINECQLPPAPHDIELCRLVLTGAVPKLQAAPELFATTTNTVDLRHRTYAGSQRRHPVAIGLLPSIDATVDDHSRRLALGLNSLVQSLPGLYPQLHVHGGNVRLRGSAEVSDLGPEPPTMFFLTGQQAQALTAPATHALKRYVDGGGTIALEVAIADTPLEKLMFLAERLQQAMAQLDPINGFPEHSLAMPLAVAERDRWRSPLAEEYQDVDMQLKEQIQQSLHTFNPLMELLNVQLQPWVGLGPTHPLRREPFVFDALPYIKSYPIQVLQGPGLVIILGQLSDAWQRSTHRPQRRESLRTAQEFGINLLHYAWQRQRLFELQQPLPEAE